MDKREPGVDANDSPGNGVTGTDDPPDSGTSGNVSTPAPTLEAVTAERDHLIEEKNDLLDRLLRRAAELENIRRRSERERADVLEFAHTETLRAILPILDDFERALKTETMDKEYARGMELIYHQLSDTLKKLGLEPISAKGQKFDPHFHHAVDMLETDQVEDHTILDEYQQGYNFRGRLLRPAMVKVAVTKK
jgi:molecular chaperone GrpE